MMKNKNKTREHYLLQKKKRWKQQTKRLLTRGERARQTRTEEKGVHTCRGSYRRLHWFIGKTRGCSGDDDDVYEITTKPPGGCYRHSAR
jgi:hypothetical protein